MSSVTVIDVPDSLKQRLAPTSETIHFSQIEGIYRDGIDWIQYDEIIPRPSDILKTQQHFSDNTVKNNDNYIDFASLDEHLCTK